MQFEVTDVIVLSARLSSICYLGSLPPSAEWYFGCLTYLSN
uniref:Uncharacterized protein n=1 Tax=Arundo donax TaxID=35708 RepID=A0A0A8Y5M8_ARUDO